ncbi:Uncharacterised protein [Mycobacterium tuberculosis]|nr:Uncharacterised protein [Mycobacterium tuberculosis]
MRWFVYSINLAVAVLLRSAAKSSDTPTMVRCNARSVSMSSSTPSATRVSPVCSSTTKRHTRCRKRYAPTTSFVAHGREASSGPIDIS